MFELRGLLRDIIRDRYAIHSGSNYTDCLIEATVDRMVVYSKTEEFRDNIDRCREMAAAFLYGSAFGLGPDLGMPPFEEGPLSWSA